jgi:hypothetical protein
MIAEFVLRVLIVGVRMPLFMELMVEDMDESPLAPAATPVMPAFRTLDRMPAPSAALSVELAGPVEPLYPVEPVVEELPDA